MAQGSEIRVCFASSPTGYLHVGGARSALPENLREMAEQELISSKVWQERPAHISPESFDAALNLLKTRARRLSDFSGSSKLFSATISNTRKVLPKNSCPIPGSKI